MMLSTYNLLSPADGKPVWPPPRTWSSVATT